MGALCFKKGRSYWMAHFTRDYDTDAYLGHYLDEYVCTSIKRRPRGAAVMFFDHRLKAKNTNERRAYLVRKEALAAKTRSGLCIAEWERKSVEVNDSDQFVSGLYEFYGSPKAALAALVAEGVKRGDVPASVIGRVRAALTKARK